MNGTFLIRNVFILNIWRQSCNVIIANVNQGECTVTLMWEQIYLKVIKKKNKKTRKRELTCTFACTNKSGRYY